MTKAEILATFIVQNWHYCPIDDEVPVKDCEGWTGCSDGFNQTKCVKCILKHTDDIFIMKKN